MPIYEYRCSSCSHEFETLQKFSDPLLKVCPSCGTEALVKKLSAAGFQLKGSGWYATDFKGSGKPAPKTGTGGEEAKGEAKDTKTEKSDAKTESKPEAKTETKAETKAPTAPASGGST